MKTIALDHPLITHKLSILRSKTTGTKEFRELISEIAVLLCYEAFKDEKLDDITIETPITTMKTGRLNEDKYAFLPILRAGMGMVDGVLQVLPNAKIGHIGMYRDEETFEPHNYFFKVPKDIENREVTVLDPKEKTEFVMKNIPRFNGMVRDRVIDTRNLIVDFSDLIAKAVPTERMFMQKPDVLQYVEKIYPEIICYALFKNDKHDSTNDIDVEEGTESFTEKVFQSSSVISMGKTAIGLEQAGFDKFIISIPYTLKATRFLTPQFLKGALPIQRNMKINPDLIYQLSLIKFVYGCYAAYNGGASSSEFVKEVIRRNVVFHFYCETGVGFTINLRELKSYRWQEGDVPKKYDDHCLDELRYYIMSKPENNAPQKDKTDIQKDKERRIKRLYRRV